ncbi:hypothetical protein [Stutzerimonas nitrititolerans]|uniref:hypothetical protein n=1 Tax=Stutzerimonas nitrititolerans TaxID=2482751 RepID=UPI0028A27442|nr:hypothetical protein [Stutzerimonas nitrititolerans]
MSLFSQFASLFNAIFQPGKSPAYTTLIYPTHGKPVVVHDGLGVRHERTCYQYPDSLIEDGVETITSFGHYPADDVAWVEPLALQAGDFLSSTATSCFEFMEANRINPANGMPMMDSGFDVMGNPYGMDTASDSLSFDHGVSDMGGSSSSFGFD